jgi:hypothetical protein
MKLLNQRTRKQQDKRVTGYQFRSCPLLSKVGVSAYLCQIQSRPQTIEPGQVQKAVTLRRISFGCIVNTFDKSRLWSISQISCTDRVTVKKCYMKSRKTGIAHI